ncbi:MAG: TcpQ domain-containing protein [Rhodospirillales bacterium]|nr:TcpQ domain-containing protein [Rhodospirillales bacterium]
MTDAILAGAVLAAMAGLAVHDARRALVDPRMVLALLGAAAAWRLAGSGGGEDAWPRLAAGVLGAALGVAAVMVPIGVAAWLGRRWPLYPGDAMMLGAFGFLLGVPGLAWTMLLGSALALVHRFCVQRKRGRPVRKGLVPLGPGMCAGAAAVFLCMNFGAALAQDARDVKPTPLPAVSAGGGVPALAATELGPALEALPPELAGRVVSVETAGALPFPALVRRLVALAGVAMRIEERPARTLGPETLGPNIAGGGVVLEDPPPLRPVWEGPLSGLLDRVAWLSGYDWSWEEGAVVFHRYWDVEQRGPAPGPETAQAAAPESVSGGWAVDPDEHRTLRGVLESWAARAGWTLVWNAGRDYGLGAAAVFGGGFLEAADLLLSGPATMRVLDVRAYAANRHLVVDDADGAGW